MVEEIKPDFAIEIYGRENPAPIMEVCKSLKYIESGKTLAIYCTDEDVACDIFSWLEKEGHKILIRDKYENYWRIVIQKK